VFLNKEHFSHTVWIYIMLGRQSCIHTLTFYTLPAAPELGLMRAGNPLRDTDFRRFWFLLPCEDTEDNEADEDPTDKAVWLGKAGVVGLSDPN
jgi:hypothetical protein